MKLTPLEVPEIPQVAGWLSREENYTWLDFGRGRQRVSEVELAIMIQRPYQRVYTFAAAAEPAAGPIGVVGIDDISTSFGSANLWYVLGEKRFARKGYTTGAVRAGLDEAFRALALHSIQAWTVRENVGSIAVLRKVGFLEVGVRRECHRIGDELRDRLIFDILASDYLHGR